MWPFHYFKKEEELHYKLSQNELKEAINILSDMSYTFLSSEILMTLDGRNEVMKSRMFSYAGILGFLYEAEFCYGKISDIVDSNISSHYQLVKSAMLDESHKKRLLKNLRTIGLMSYKLFVIYSSPQTKLAKNLKLWNPTFRKLRLFLKSFLIRNAGNQYYLCPKRQQKINTQRW